MTASGNSSHFPSIVDHYLVSSISIESAHRAMKTVLLLFALIVVTTALPERSLAGKSVAPAAQDNSRTLNNPINGRMGTNAAPVKDEAQCFCDSACPFLYDCCCYCCKSFIRMHFRPFVQL